MKKFVSVLLAVCAAAFCLRVSGGNARAESVAVSAASAVLIEAGTGTVLFAENPDERRAMASTTKIMTAILTIEAGDLDREFTVDPFAIQVEGTSMGLREGDIVSRRDLLYGILLPSGNDAANAAAVSVAGSISAFADKMNRKAEALGLDNTHFVTPSGLDANEHYTTARDLAALTAYAMKNEIFREIVSCTSARVSFGNPPYERTLYNSNKMLTRYDGAIGVKTGFTDDARRCLVSAAERGGVMLIAVTLNDPDDWNDHAKMLDYGFSREAVYQLETSCSAEVAVAGTGEKTGVYAPAAQLCLTPEQRGRLERRVMLPRMVYGGVKRGDRLGELIYLVDGKRLRSVPLYAERDIPEKKGSLNFWQKLLGMFGIYV